MKIKEFRQLKKHLDALEDQAIGEGLDVNSAEYKESIEKFKKQFFSQKGISYEEYKEIEDNLKEGEDLSENEALYFPLLAKKSKENAKKKDVEIQNDMKEIQNEFQSNLDNAKQEIEQKAKKIEKQFIEELSKVKQQILEIPKQLTKEDVEYIISPLIPEIPEQKEFNQEEIKGLRADQVDIDLKVFDKKINKEIKQLKQEMTEYTNKMSVPSGGGRSGGEGKGSRFFNWGMPDKGSYGTAIPDNRYSQKKDVGYFVDDEVPTGTKDSSNVTFTLAHTPISGSLKLFLGGVKLEITNDYSISGNTITMVFAPDSGETLLADYRRN